MSVGTSSRASNKGSKWREVYGFHPIPGSAYPVGSLMQIAPLQQQVWSDMRTVAPAAAAAAIKGLIGLVADEWATNAGVTIAPTAGGFDGKGTTTAPGTAGSAPLGTDSVPITVRGIHMRALIDNSGGAAVAITHGVVLSSSSVTLGRLQGAPAAPVVGAFIGCGLLNGAAPFNTLGNGAVAAATQTITVGAAPAAGDIYQIPLQIPFTDNSQGIAQYRVVTVGPLTATQATNTTTAAAAIAAALTADPVASVWYTNNGGVAAVVTLTVAAGNQFRIGGQGISQGGYLWGSSWELTTSGTVGNSLTLGALVVVTGGGTITAGGGAAAFTGYPAGATLFAGGTGYFGTCPVFVGGMFG